MSQTPAGWYPSDGQERYWDGTQWTEQTRPAAAAAPQAPFTPPQPKKKHTLRNVLIAVVVLFVLIVGGCTAILAAGGKAVNDAINDEVKNDTPTAVTEGKSFEHDGFTASAGWSIKPSRFGVDVKGMSVTLDDDQGTTSGRSALWTIGLYDGKTKVAELTCSSNEIQEGETSKMDCISGDEIKAGDWSTVKVSDAF